jgi:acyl carrier protein
MAAGWLSGPRDVLGFSLLETVSMVEFDEVRQLIGEMLQLGERVWTFGPDTPLLGNIPEFDSMAVVALIKALEERFDIQVADDEISAETFETIGNVHAFVRDKLLTTT